MDIATVSDIFVGLVLLGAIVCLLELARQAIRRGGKR